MFRCQACGLDRSVHLPGESSKHIFVPLSDNPICTLCGIRKREHQWMVHEFTRQNTAEHIQQPVQPYDAISINCLIREPSR